MNALWNRGIQAFAGAVERDNKKLRTKKQNRKADKEKFIFSPDLPDDKQLELFMKKFNNRTWDGNLTFRGYKGTFKIEYWIYLESKLRDIQHLRFLSFVDTQVDKEHLTLLGKWLQWLTPNRLELVFKQNELDDQDVEEFVYSLFKRKIRVMKLLFISNPGVFKGNFLSELKFYLDNRYKTNLRYYYKIIKNKQQKSVAILRIQKNKSDEEVQAEISRAEQQINQTYFYQIGLDSCFDDTNTEAFEYLIKQCYHDDNLEQLQGLDVSNCSLGSYAVFYQLCKRISTAKGLLSLALRNQPHIHQANIVEALMGDRYDQLRINHLDISNNQKMIEKAYKQFSDNIISQSCKSFTTGNTLDQHLPVIVKFYYMTESFKHQIELLKQRLLKKQQIFKLTLKVLDMSLTENYNRHDLVRKFIDSVVCNEFSSVKKLILSNCDIGRLNAYTDSFVAYKAYIQDKIQNDPLYKDFKVPLHEIVLPAQKYRMEEEPMARFFNEVVFTTTECVLQIYHLKLISCFRQTNREEGFDKALKDIQKKIDENPNIRFTLKSIEFQDTYMSKFDLVWFKLFLLTPNIQLESLIVKTDEISNFNSATLYDSVEQYTKTMADNQLHSLKVLKLDDIFEHKIELQGLVRSFILNKKMRLEELSISKITTENKDADEWKDVEDLVQARDPSEKLALKKITFGDFSESGGSKQLIKYLVISKVSQIESLHLKTQHLSDYLDSFKKQYQDLLQLDIDPLSKLHNLTLEKITIEGKEAWNTFSSLFIFNQAVTLKSLHVSDISLSNSMIEGLQLSVVQVIEHLSANQAPFSLHTLQITNCQLEKNDFLTIFLANPLCKVETLEIKQCKQFLDFIKIFKEYHEANQDKLLYTFALKHVVLEQAVFDDEIFDVFVNRIIFNQERQCVEKLHLIDCQLSSSQIEILAQTIKRIKAYHQSNELKRYYKINDLNFGKNPGISQEAWIKLFDSLQNVDMTGEHQAKLIKVDDSSSEDDEKQDQTIQNIQQLINKNSLNVFEKIVHAPEIYVFEPPKQLKEVEINMSFGKIEENFKKLMYFQIIQGLIIFPENKLEHLKLTDLDLDMFVEETRKVTAYMKTHYEKVLQRPLPKIHLQDISISKLTNQSQASIQEFFSVFLCNNKIDLQKLTMNDIKSHLINSLEKLAPQKQQYSLIYLDLLNCEETLDNNLSSFFIKSILLGQVFPLKSIKIGKLLKLKNPELADLITDIDLGKIQVPLEKLQLQIGAEDQYGIYQVLLCTMIGSQYSKLRKLVILEDPSKFQALDKLMQNLPQHDIKLEKLEFNNVILSVKFIDFLKKIRTTLKSFITKTINIDKNAIQEVKDAINNFKIVSQPLYDCIFKYTIVESESEFIQTQFIFHERFQFRKISVIKFDNEIKFGLKYNFIKYLNLSFGLFYNSSQQWKPENYELLGNKFIYNRESQLEQLVLHQCHMKIDGVKALVKGADNFRKSVAQDKLESKLQMKLKRINVYYSLYFSEEGFELFHKNVTYFEYFNIERFEFQVTNYNDNMALSLCKCANEWLTFQRQYKRQYTRFFPLQYWDLGRNEFVQSEQAWNELCDTFLFTDKTPYMSILNIHFMSMTDPIVDMILAKSNRYFNSKSSSYVYPVKILNYSLNTALTADGWKRISEEFFFHPKVELEELNLNSTMLDEPQKIYAIRDAVIKKAMSKPNQTLKLHSLLCFNLWLKDSIYNYLSPHPLKYKEPFDLPVKIDYNSWKPGWITGIPESFGDFQQQVQSAIYNREQFINTSEWKVADDFRVSQLHQNFIKSFIVPINEYYRSKGRTEFSLNFDTTTLDTLSNIFKYPAIEPGKPYPYNLLFQQDFFDFQKDHSCIITKINVVQTKVNKLEEITQMDIYRLWKNLKSKKTSIDQVFIDYELNDDLIELMYSDGYTEREIINLIRLFPPSKIRAQNTITIQAIKGIYSIFWDSHNFEYSTLQYDFDNFLNIGIGYALREIVYNSKPVGCKRHFKKFAYALLDIFVKDVKKYVLDHQVQDLNLYLSKQKLFFFLLGFTNLLFFASCIVPPVYFSFYYNYNDDTDNTLGKARYCQGIPVVANYIYYGFAVLSFSVEAWLFKKTSLLLSNHTEYLIDIKIEDEEELNTHKVVPISDEEHEQHEQQEQQIQLQQEQDKQDALKRQITRSQKQFTSKLNEFARSSTGEWVNYLIKIGLAQLAKLDLYNDIVFILTCYFCDQMILFYIALSITAFNTVYYFLQFVELIYTRLKESNKTAKLLSTKFINDFFSIAIAGRHIALATILDQVAPFNVSVIPNNFITRFLIPNQAGRSINNSVKGYLFKFSCEDAPQMLVQMYFVVDQAIRHGGDLSWSIYLTVCVSVLSLILSFVRFMSIRPSSISQTEFDKLSEQKDKYRAKVKKDLIQNEQQLLQDYCKLNSDFSENISEDHKNNEMDQLL